MECRLIHVIWRAACYEDELQDLAVNGTGKQVAS